MTTTYTLGDQNDCFPYFLFTHSFSTLQEDKIGTSRGACETLGAKSKSLTNIILDTSTPFPFHCQPPIGPSPKCDFFKTIAL
jgi:hypothetical protein